MIRKSKNIPKIKFEDKMPSIKGHIKIVNNDNGEVLYDKDNLILLSMRLLALQLLSNSNLPTNFESLSDLKNYYRDLPTSVNIKRNICGFTFGNSGTNNVAPFTPYVPSFKDTTLGDNPTFHPIPFITTNVSGSQIVGSTEYDNLSQIINSPSIYTDSNTTVLRSESAVKYFNGVIDGNSNYAFYYKVIDKSKNDWYIDINNTGTISLTFVLDVESHDLIGQTLNELGLVIADDVYDNSTGDLIAIMNNTSMIGSRVTFTNFSLNTSLLSSFSVYYTINI